MSEGVFMYDGDESFLVSTAENKTVKIVIQGVKTAVDVTDVGKDINAMKKIKSLLKNEEFNKILFETAAADDDGKSVQMDAETIVDIIKKKDDE